MRRLFYKYCIGLITIFVMVSMPSYANIYHSLPTGYTEIEYIQAPKERLSTSQVWTVPINLQENYNYIFEFTPLSWEDSYYGHMIGGNNEGTVFPKCGIFKLDNGWGGMEKRFITVFWNYNLETRRSSPGGNYRVYSGVRSKFQLHCKNYDSSQGAEIVVDNEGYATYTHTSTQKFISGYSVQTGVYEIPLLTTIDGNTERGALMQLHNFKVEDKNGKAIYDYVPCKRNSDSKAGLYDVVNCAFYYPSAFTLTAGPEIQNASTKRTIHVATAGTLPNLISESEKYTIEELTLTGELNGTDFRLLRDMAGNNYLGEITPGKLRFLDLSGARIVAGGEKYLDASSIEVEKNSFVVEGCHDNISNNDEIPKLIFTGCSLSLILPNSVTSIGKEAFMYCYGLKSITIPNSVKSIGPSAFWKCTGLTSITIPNSVTRIENCTFYGCSGLSSIIIPNSITSIGQQAFEGCTGITSITIPNSVTSIGSSAFLRCTGVTSIIIPNSVTSIGSQVFDSSLSSLNVESGNPKYDSRNGCNAIIETATNKLVLGLNNTTIPNTITTIGRWAFADSKGLSAATIPNSVKTIEEYAFAYCNDLTSITIPNSVITIGESAFYGCSSLSSITIPTSVNDIGSYAFHGTAWYNNQSDGLIYIGKNAYTYKGTMPENSKITIKDGTLALSGSIFKDSSGLTSITIPNSVINIGSNAFEGCSGLTSITIPNFVTIIRDGTFKNCSKLTSITIPNTVTNIGNNVFEDCNGLTSITIPNSVTRIGEYAFHNCSSLTSITIPNSVSEICPATFAECSSLTSITIPTSVTNIGGSAFAFCNSLTSITIPNSVTNIGSAAFVFCNNLTSITIPNSVTSIGEGAFIECSGLTSISIPNSVTSIGAEAFYGCHGLKDIISKIKTPFEINENVFSVYSTATLTVPIGTKSAYQSTAGWNKFTNIVEIEADNIIHGDANGDKEVNVSDIVEVVNFIMNNASAIFLRANADLNGDGEVNVTDIVMMVNLIMSGQTSAVRTMSNRAGSMTDADCMRIDDVIINAGETKQLNISLDNPDKKYTAFQFDMTLPEGITIVKNSNGKLMASLDTERKDDHTLNVSEMGNNTYRFLAFSMSNAELYGTNGPLVNITLGADVNMDSGTNAAALKSQVFTATDGTQYKWIDLPFSILVNGSENTGIDEISQNGQNGGLINVYTLTGLLLFSVPQSEFSEKWHHLPSGVYIVNGQKMIKSENTK